MITKEESVAEYYLERLNKVSNPLPVLVSMCKSIFDIDDDKKMYPLLGKLLKIYGAKLVYFSILDSAGFDVITKDSIGGAIAYNAKQRLDNKYIPNPNINLNKVVVDVEKNLARTRRLKIPNVFEEKND